MQIPHSLDTSVGATFPPHAVQSGQIRQRCAVCSAVPLVSSLNGSSTSHHSPQQSDKKINYIREAPSSSPGSPWTNFPCFLLNENKMKTCIIKWGPQLTGQLSHQGWCRCHGTSGTVNTGAQRGFHPRKNSRIIISTHKEKEGGEEEGLWGCEVELG